MTGIVEVALRAGLLILVYMTAVFLLAQLLHRSDIVDVAWGLGFIVVAAYAAFGTGLVTSRAVLMLALVGAWGVRLAAHVASRLIGSAEDFRYAAWRRDWGRWFLPRSFLQVFMLQGLFMWIISASIIVVGAALPQELGPFDLIAVAVFALGLTFEALGDYQLTVFKSDPANKGRVMDSGVWRYTRHPNYFGEVVVWWGLWLLALPVEYGLYAVISPITITVLLLRVSGIPMLERKYDDNPEYQAYKARTSAFLPMPPKRRASS